jgi:DNA-binding NtrC family response regulator
MAPVARVSLRALRGAAPEMNRLYDHIERIAATDTTVLVLGESGTGKELVARTVHELSARTENPFVAVNCATLDRGDFQRADGGTLFLDDITALAPDLQVALLRLLETGVLVGGGDAGEARLDLRVIAATDRDLREAVRDGHLRQDLMYRLVVFPLRVPPLRERRGDVELLARRFVSELNTRERAHKVLSQRSVEVLKSHPWPGNVRELRTTLQRAFVLSDRTIEIGASALGTPAPPPRISGGSLSFGVGTRLDTVQREMILATLAHFNGDKRRAARTLGISLKTLYNRLGRYRVVRPGTAPAVPRPSALRPR